MVRLLFSATLLLSLGSILANADDPQDYLIQKVCVDANGNVLLADPYNPPMGSHLRNLRVGEPLPYNKHDQPGPGHPSGYQRHDSYPVLDKDGRELSLNPFFYGADNPGNGYDIYCLRDGWASAPSSRDGGGFSSTFFGESNEAVVPYNGWLFFPANFATDGYTSGSIKKPIAGKYWEQNGEPWPGSESAGFLAHGFSETSWRLIKDCQFGGMEGAPTKQMDAILSVHGYISKGTPPYDFNMAHGHLEIFYFTKLYGVTRWEVWTPIGQLDDYNKPSELRAKAIHAARLCANPILAAGEWYVQPSDLPPTPENRFIATTFIGEDGIKNTYAVTDVRDWSAVTVLSVPQPPPPCPIPDQNLLNNFHFDAGTFFPWQKSGDTSSPDWNLLQSHTLLDTKYARKTAEGGVRYLAIHGPSDSSSKQLIYQDIPAKNIKDGIFVASLRLRSMNKNGVIRMLLQQVDAKGGILSTDIDSTHTVGPNNSIFSFSGVDDPNPNASVVLSSHTITDSAQVSTRSETAFLRFSIQPQSPGEFDVIDASLFPD